jgi:tRNA-(ms[2]io[6]A)-hydroxylase
MIPMPVATDLPLRTRTPPAWARAVLAAPLLLLDDHAHLERKATANALGLLSRYPSARRSGRRRDARRQEAWTRTLARVARDEILHLELVLSVLARRGGALGRHHANPYAQGLHRLVRPGGGADGLVDRLLVSALIEARSCERFEVLGAAAADDDLARLYRGLESSERGHYRHFVRLATWVDRPDAVRARFDALLDEEARILAALPFFVGVHGGAPDV